MVLQLINRRPSKDLKKANDLVDVNASESTGGQSENNADEWGEFLHLPGKSFSILKISETKLLEKLMPKQVEFGYFTSANQFENLLSSRFNVNFS